MFDHVALRASDRAASERFYDTVLRTIGAERTHSGDGDRADFAHLGGGNGSFSVLLGDHATEHVHIAFPATDDATVDAFHRVAVEAGHRDNGAPGERPVYHPGYYAAFVLDPDGNNVEVVNHNR